MKQQTFHNQRGMSLIELVAGLAIAAAVIVGVLSFFQSTSGTQKAMQMSTDMNALRAGMSNLHRGRYDPINTNLNEVLASAGQVPTTINVDDSASPYVFTHTLNGNVTVTTGADPSWYYITYDTLPKDACISLLTSSGSWPRVKVDAAAPTGPGEALSATVLQGPASGAAATTACASADSNTIHFVSN